MKAKKSVTVFLSLVLSIIILFLVAVYIYDPLQIFHKAWGRDITFQKNMRQQAAGIINNYEFDSVILGTSMLENSSANEASELLGGQFVNISMGGSDFFERKLILNYIQKKKMLKKVIYSLDSDKFIYQIKGYKHYPLQNYTYLYDTNPFNDIKVYMNNKFLKCLIKFDTSEECIGIKNTLDRPGAWYKSTQHSMRYGGLNKWFDAKNNSQIRNYFKNISSISKKVKDGERKSLKNINKKIIDAKNYVDENILDVVKANPQTEFILISPPYSRIYYAIWAQYNLPAYEIHKAMLKYLSQKSGEFSNLKLYGYEDTPLVDDIAQYKDPKHYHYSINSWILQEISKNRGLLSNKNIDQYLNKNSKKAKVFDLIELGHKTDTYLNSNKR